MFSDSRRRRKRFIFIGIILIIVIAGIYYFKDRIVNKDLGAIETDNDLIEEYDEFYINQPWANWAAYKEEKLDLKAIFMTGHTLAYKPRFTNLMEFVNSSEINGLVIDVKNDEGILSYKSNIEMANQAGADKNPTDLNFVETMKEIKASDIYPIARIVTFKDRTYSSSNKDQAVLDNQGEIWQDNKKDSWLNPYDESSWDYPIAIAREAAVNGFKEIQFDYVRFPTDGKRGLIDYGPDEGKSMAESIGKFLFKAREELEPLGVVVSADVFGLVTTSEDDMGLGQHLETLATATDIICPMVYPSHYSMGSYGVAYPDSDPYKIVHHSMKVAKERIDNLESNEKKARLRPWLQDFSAPWLKRDYGSHYVNYGAEQIRAQIDATYDTGITEWIFWNAANRYTQDGYLDN